MVVVFVSSSRPFFSVFFSQNCTGFFILLTSTLVPGINYFVVIKNTTHLCTHVFDCAPKHD